MKSIETYYKGYKFRSRLEARWAVFFDACGVKWEYEPEGFVWDDGMTYLPDFLLHDVRLKTDKGEPLDENDLFLPPDIRRGDLWVEVKGRMTDFDREKISRFSHYTSLLIVGNIPEGNSVFECFGDVNKYPDDDYFGVNFFNFDTVYGDNDRRQQQ